jgi:hypothetical protein
MLRPLTPRELRDLQGLLLLNRNELFHLLPAHFPAHPPSSTSAIAFILRRVEYEILEQLEGLSVAAWERSTTRSASARFESLALAGDVFARVAASQCKSWGAYLDRVDAWIVEERAVAVIDAGLGKSPRPPRVRRLDPNRRRRSPQFLRAVVAVFDRVDPTSKCRDLWKSSVTAKGQRRRLSYLFSR